MAGLTALSGGRFLAATLTLVEERFSTSDLDMAGVAALFGESGVYMHTILGTAILEGAVFASLVVLANYAARQRRA